MLDAWGQLGGVCAPAVLRHVVSTQLRGHGFFRVARSILKETFAARFWTTEEVAELLLFRPPVDPCKVPSLPRRGAAHIQGHGTMAVRLESDVFVH